MGSEVVGLHLGTDIAEMQLQKQKKKKKKKDATPKTKKKNKNKKKIQKKEKPMLCMRRSFYNYREPRLLSR